MAEKNANANRPKSGTSGDGGNGSGGGGPRVRYQLPPEESSPRGSPDQTTTYKQQPWTLKRFNLYGDMPEYNNRWSMFFGFIQCGLGGLSFILGIVLIAIGAAGGHSAIGIWGGLIFIASGLVGVFSFRKPLTPLVIACFGLSAASFVIALIMFIMVCYFANVDDRAIGKIERNMVFWKDSPNSESLKKLVAQRDSQPAKIAVGAVLAIVALAEMVIAILQGLLVAKVFLVRGPQPVPANENSNRLSASNPIPAGGGGAGDQSWGEYNPPARNKPAGDQQWGEYNPPAKNKPAGDQQWGEYNPQQKPRQPEPQDVGGQEPEQEWREYKPQKGRKAMREESQKKGNAPRPANNAPPANAGVTLGAAGTVSYSAPEEKHDDQPAVSGIIRRGATGTVDVEEEAYCPPLRPDSYEEDDDYDRPPPAVAVSVEI